MQKPVNIMMPL